MSSIIPSPLGPATQAKRGSMSAADKTKLDAVSGTNTGDVTVSSPVGWLSILNQALTFALVAASDTVAGVVSLGAQTFAGVKTFAGEVAASAGVLTTFVRAAGASLVLRSSLGAAAADECVVIGSSEADGTVHADAKLLVVKTGIGGVPVERFWATKARAKVKVAAGLSYADPVLWFETSGANQLNIIQFGSGLTSTTWEFALGWYGGALAPLVQTRTSLYVSTAAGGFVAPLTPNSSDLGSASNHWRSMLLGETVQLGIAGTARPPADAANRGKLWYSKSAAGAADTIQVCLKSAADTYSWVTIGTG